MLLFPFWLGFEFILRRGGPLAFIDGYCVAWTGDDFVIDGGGCERPDVLPFVLTLVVPILVLNFAMFEIFAASVYSVITQPGARSPAAEALWLAFTFSRRRILITFIF